jgi:hypothetical protein
MVNALESVKQIKMKAITKYLGSFLWLFFIKFGYGARNEGYWNYEWMVLQLVNYVHVLNACIPIMTNYSLSYYFYGRDKQQPDGLNAESSLKLVRKAKTR